MQKLILKTKTPIENFKPKNLEFLKSFLSFYDSQLNILSILLLWSMETKVMKKKDENIWLIFFNSNSILDEIFCCDFELFDFRNLEYKKLDNSDSYFIIGRDTIFTLSDFEYNLKFNLIKAYKLKACRGIAVT